LDLEFTTDQDELRTSVRTFLERECPVAFVRGIVETGSSALSLWESMSALDWPALAIPTECGGIGLSFVEIAVLAEELGRALAPGPYLATATQFAPVVLEAGTKDHQERFLAPVSEGRLTGALALADHPRRWRVSDVNARAERKGEGWALFGEKHGVLADGTVDEVVVAARGDDGALVLVVVPGADLEFHPLRALDASRPLSSVILDGVVVAEDRLLGNPGTDAQPALTRALQEATVAIALETLGTCQRLFELTLQYAKDRHQFGVPIGSFQAVKHKMSNLFLSIERARSLAYFATAAIAEDSEQRAMATAMAKAAADDAQHVVCQDAIQTFGGIGFTWEHDCHLYVKRAITSGALFGSATEHRLDVASRLGVRSLEERTS
jgi:alkylation response protein AidB-like acyl-CoA dehydrogenase